MHDYSFFKCEFIPQKKLWKVVEEFRSTYCQEEQIPLDIEHIIEQKLGIDIIPEHGVSKSDIDAYLKSDYSAIVVDYDQYMNSQGKFERSLRFSFAHEVGHFILHKYVHKDFSIEHVNDYCQFIEHSPEKEYKSFEWQANEFAGRLLVPRERFIAEITVLFEELKENHLEHLWEESPGLVLDRFAPTLSRIFGVSDYIISRRIQEENIQPIIKELLQ